MKDLMRNCMIYSKYKQLKRNIDIQTLSVKRVTWSTRYLFCCFLVIFGSIALLNWIMKIRNISSKLTMNWQIDSFNFHEISRNFMKIHDINSDRISHLLIQLTQMRYFLTMNFRDFSWTFTNFHQIPIYWPMNYMSKTMEHWWKFAKIGPN